MDQSPLCPGVVGKHMILQVVVDGQNSLLKVVLPYPKVTSLQNAYHILIVNPKILDLMSNMQLCSKWG